jgi:NAD+ kinase
LKRVGLVVKPDKEAIRNADLFENWLVNQGHQVVRHDSIFPVERPPGSADPPEATGLYCLFVLGGDGTFLSAVRWVGDRPIPILGIKFGRVGFLAEITDEELFSTAKTILEGNFVTTPRMRLEIIVYRDGKEIAREMVLNDAVINKGALARLAHIKTFVDGHYLTTYSADGLIISTPTGSTAYSLAAGGPVIHPSVQGIIMTPICPFTLTNRPLIIPDTMEIKIRQAKKVSDIMLTFDGQIGVEIDHRDTIIARKSAHPVQMITMPQHDYFGILKAKLRWSGGRS